MLDSTRSSSIHGNDFLELVWENGEIVARGSGSSSRIQHIDEDGSITKRTSRLNPLSYSLQDHHFPPQTQRDSDMNSSHQTINAQDSSQSSQQTKNYSNNLNEEFANLFRPVVVVKDSNNPVTTGNINSHHLQQQCSLPSSPLKKPRTPKVNFSNFSIPAVFLKSTTSQQTKNHSSPARVEDIKKSSAKESDGFQQQTSLTVERSTKPVDNDEQYSQAVLGIHRSQGQLRCDQTSTTAEEALRANKAKAYNNNTNTCHEPLLASSSVCSLGASNDPNLSFRKHEDTDDSTYLSDNDDGEPEDMVKQEREGSRVKRSRNTEVHNLSEKKRREKINKKMRTLKELIPNCNKVDKASMLDDAIDYLKTLKLQLQVMSMGSGLWPVMNMMNGPHLGQLGMGFRAAQVPIPDNRLQMFGFPNQIVTMPHAHAPFFPIIANSATQPHLPTTTNLAQHLANSAAAAASLHATKLAPTQVSFQHLGTSLPLATPFIFPQK